MILRKPAVAGRFYPGEAAALKQEIDRHVPRGMTRRTALGVLSPHAGFIYSGSVAGAVYASVEIPRRIVILCPNHTGQGHALGVWPEGAWRTPLGLMPVDADMAAALCRAGHDYEAAQKPEQALDRYYRAARASATGAAAAPLARAETLAERLNDDATRQALARLRNTLVQTNAAPNAAMSDGAGNMPFVR